MIDILQKDTINYYYRESKYREMYYLLAMTDYLSHENNIPLANKYDKLRRGKLRKTEYPRSAWIAYYTNKDTTLFKRCRKEAIPEFLKYNIVESEVRNVY